MKNSKKMIYLNQQNIIFLRHKGGKIMASILSRFNDILKANINELLDKFEDPSKMIDQYLRDMM